MMPKVYLIIAVLCLGWTNLKAQYRMELDGQLSTIYGYSPENELDVLLGGRYLPRLSLGRTIDSTRLLDFEASLNIGGSLSTMPWDTLSSDGQLSPYRLWLRYSGPQFELRAGLQKLDFGSASLIRPLQWFNQIDPRDPLQLTNGVYGLLGRYYFLNNANVWLWVLYGNEKTRGFDVVETRDDIPEFGGRIQYPLGPGELAFTYHHRTAEFKNELLNLNKPFIPEDRWGLDGKWDVGVGLWFEMSHSHKHRSLIIQLPDDERYLTHQSFINVGMDYTFDLGNGLNVMLEHLIVSYDKYAFAFEEPVQLSALMMNYPLGMFDQLMGMIYLNWVEKDPMVLINYQHQFKYISTYLMAYYNPKSTQGIQDNDLVNTFVGPGLRLMLVYNH